MYPFDMLKPVLLKGPFYLFAILKVSGSYFFARRPSLCPFLSRTHDCLHQCTHQSLSSQLSTCIIYYKVLLQVYFLATKFFHLNIFSLLFVCALLPNFEAEVWKVGSIVNVLDALWEFLFVRLRHEGGCQGAQDSHAGKDAIHQERVVGSLQEIKTEEKKITILTLTEHLNNSVTRFRDLSRDLGFWKTFLRVCENPQIPENLVFLFISSRLFVQIVYFFDDMECDDKHSGFPGLLIFMADFLVLTRKLTLALQCLPAE